jgi:thiol-disulfide isomerase/thioredoxin
VERTPGEAAVEDLAMLVLLGYAWWGNRAAPAPDRAWNWKVVWLGTALFLLVGGFRFVPQMDRLEQSDLQPGVRLTGLALRGASVDLMKGDHLVELFSPSCHRCLEEAPRLNQWVDAPGLPPLVALHGYPPEARLTTEFVERAQPRYPIASISRTDFLRLTWKHGYPRLAHVRDGVVQRVWESNALPTLAQLQAEFNGEKTREENEG